jgi:hypothetical protein
MKEEIESVMRVLVGLPLLAPYRAANMMMFGFGKTVHDIDLRGNPCEVPEYSLHVQCHWRILANHPSPRILVGSSDLYYPSDPSLDRRDEKFQWDLIGANLCDRRMNGFMEEHATCPLIVESIEADEVCGLRIRFTEGFLLELLPDASPQDRFYEEWRLLLPGTKRPHFIVGRSNTDYLD